MYLPRTLETFILKASAQMPVLLLTGPRQVGKTTLLRRLCGEDSKQPRQYVTLDDPLLLSLAREEPALFMQRFPPPVLIDEIQYAPDLLRHIKLAVDRDPTPGRFWLTGSQPLHLMSGVAESLAGRVGVVQLLGFSHRELHGQATTHTPFIPTPERLAERRAGAAALDLPTLYRSIWRGGLPVAARDEAVDWHLYYGSYVQTYLQRDVRDLARVGDELAFLRFLRATAARTAQLLNLTELARDAGVAPNTAKQWLSILQSSGIVYLLEPYHANITKRLVKTPKLYLLDTGLCAYLTEWSSPATLEAGAMSGAILETWVISELLKSYWHNGRRAPFHYYRDKDQREIDLVIAQDGVLHPLEIKKTAAPNAGDIRHFAALERLGVPIGPGGIICLASESLPLNARCEIIPVGMV